MEFLKGRLPGELPCPASNRVAALQCEVNRQLRQGGGPGPDHCAEGAAEDHRRPVRLRRRKQVVACRLDVPEGEMGVLCTLCCAVLHECGVCVGGGERGVREYIAKFRPAPPPPV